MKNNALHIYMGVINVFLIDSSPTNAYQFSFSAKCPVTNAVK